MLWFILQKLYLWFRPVLYGDQVYPMMVIFFCKRHGECATWVVGPVGIPDVLTLMDMSTSEIVGMLVPSVHVHLLLSSNDNLLAGITLGNVCIFSIHVSHHDER